MSALTAESPRCNDQGEPRLKYLFMRYDSAIESPTSSSGESFSSLTSISGRTYSNTISSISDRTHSGNSSHSGLRRRRQTSSAGCESSDNEHAENAVDDEVFLENKNNNTISKNQREQISSQDKNSDSSSCLFCNALVKEKQYYLWESRFTRSAYCSRCVKDGAGKRYISYWGTPAYEHGSWRKRYRNGKSTNIDLSPLIDVLQKIDNMDTSMGKPRRQYVETVENTVSDKYEDNNNNVKVAGKPEVEQEDRISDDNSANRNMPLGKGNTKKNETKHDQEDPEAVKTSNEVSNQMENYSKSNENFLCKEANSVRRITNRTPSPSPNRRTRRDVNKVNDPNNNKAETRSSESIHKDTKESYISKHHQNKPTYTKRNRDVKDQNDLEIDSYLRSDSDSEFDDVVVKAAEFIENEFIYHTDSDVKNKQDNDKTYVRKHLETATSSRRESENRQSDDSIDLYEDDTDYREFHDGLQQAHNRRWTRRRSSGDNTPIAQLAHETNGRSNIEETEYDFINQSRDIEANSMSTMPMQARRPSMQRRKGSLLDTEILEERSHELINLSNETTDKDLYNAGDRPRHIDEDNENYRQFHDDLQQTSIPEYIYRQRRKSRDEIKTVAKRTSNVLNDDEAGCDIGESPMLSRRTSMQWRRKSLLATEITEETSYELINKSNETINKTLNNAEDNNKRQTTGESESISSSDEPVPHFNNDKRRLSRTEADFMLTLNNAGESTEDEDASFMKIRNKIANLSNLSKRIGRGNDHSDRQNYKATGYLLDKYLRRARRASLKARRKSSLVEIPKEIVYIQKNRNDGQNQSPQRYATNACSGKTDVNSDESDQKTINTHIHSKENNNDASNMENRNGQFEDNDIVTNSSSCYLDKSNKQDGRKCLQERKDSIPATNSSTKHIHVRNGTWYDQDIKDTEVTSKFSPALPDKNNQSKANARNSQTSKCKPDYQRDTKTNSDMADASYNSKQQNDSNVTNGNMPNIRTGKPLLKAKSDLQYQLNQYHSERPKKTSLQEDTIEGNDKDITTLALDSGDSDEQELSWRSRGYSNDFYLTRKSIIGTEIIRSFNKAISRRTKDDNQSSETVTKRKPASAPVSRKSSRASLVRQVPGGTSSSANDNQFSETIKRKTSSSAPVSRKSSSASLVRQLSRENNNPAHDSYDITPTERRASRESRESKDSDYKSADSSDSEHDDSARLNRKRSVADLRAAFEKAAAQTKRTYTRFKTQANADI